MAVTVWDDDQAIADDPPAEFALQLWAETARRLIGPTNLITLTVDCDDSDTEMRLRVAGFHLGEVDVQPEETPAGGTIVLEREGPLDELLEPVLRLPPDAALGALAIADDRGVDFDYGAGLDVWGPGAVRALREASAALNIPLRERPPED